MIKLFTRSVTKNASVYDFTQQEPEASLPNLMDDSDFLEYLEEHSVPEQEKQIAFASWIKENEAK